MGRRPRPMRDPLTGLRGQQGHQYHDIGQSAQDVRSTIINPVNAATSAVMGRVKAQAINQICNYLHLPSDQVNEGLELVSLTQTALSSSLSYGSVTAFLRLHSAMFMSGVHAMESAARVQANLCAAHTFGYWLGASRGAYRPQGLPHSHVQYRQFEDSVSDDGVSAMEWGQRWNSTHNETLQTLSRSIDLTQARSVCETEFPGMVVRRTDNNTITHMMKSVILRDFGNSPSTAAAVFFADRIKNAARVEKRVSVLVYRECPYIP